MSQLLQGTKLNSCAPRDGEVEATWWWWKGTRVIIDVKVTGASDSPPAPF